MSAGDAIYMVNLWFPTRGTYCCGGHSVPPDRIGKDLMDMVYYNGPHRSKEDLAMRKHSDHWSDKFSHSGECWYCLDCARKKGLIW